MLLKHGANVGAEDKEGGTPLHAAAIFASAEVVPVLLEHGANVGAEDKEGKTPLDAAAGSRIAEAVLKNADADYRFRNEIAMAKRFKKVMEILSEHGAKEGPVVV